MSAPLAPYKAAFIDLLLDAGVLSFGDFVTKSGRRTPYFINTGNFRRGDHLDRLAESYASALLEHFGDDFDNLYGPAYKGIPLAATAACALARRDRLVTVTFNRKEAKDHGEGGALIGHKYAAGDRVVIVEDVITAGTSVGESVPLITATPGARVVGLLVAVDRQERGPGGQAALVEASQKYGLKARAIVTIDELVAYLKGRQVNGQALLDEALLTRIAAYRASYGA